MMATTGAHWVDAKNCLPSQKWNHYNIARKHVTKQELILKNRRVCYTIGGLYIYFQSNDTRRDYAPGYYLWTCLSRMHLRGMWSEQWVPMKTHRTCINLNRTRNQQQGAIPKPKPAQVWHIQFEASLAGIFAFLEFWIQWIFVKAGSVNASSYRMSRTLRQA